MTISLSVQQLFPAGGPPRAALQLLLRLLSDGLLPSLWLAGGPLRKDLGSLRQGRRGGGRQANQSGKFNILVFCSFSRKCWIK